MRTEWRREVRHWTALVMAGVVLASADAPLRAAELDCLMQPREIVTVSAAVEGVLDRVAVDRGDLVKTGMALATLESSLERNAVEIARARSIQDYAIKASQARADFGARSFLRTSDMFKKNLVPLKELDDAETAKVLAEFGLIEANEQKRLAALDLERAEAALALRTIKSPINGIVIERLRHPGELASREHPIVRIARLDPLRVEVFVPIALYGKVAVGQTATVIPESPLNQPREARVIVVDKVADAASSTFGVRLEVANPGNRVPAGLKCKVRIG
jgi:RND family efflux transporter MFP subunit